MDKNEIELVVARMIAEAKLEVVQKRLELVLWIGGALFAMFGVIVPVWQTSRSSDRLEAATRQMKNEMAEMAQTIRADSRMSAARLEQDEVNLRAAFKESDAERRSDVSSAVRKLEEESQRMRKQFDELAGTQLRKPVLECLSNGRSIEGTAFALSPSRSSLQLELRNGGDGPARNIRVRIYSNLEKQFDLGGEQTQWQPLALSDEPTYVRAFEAYQPFVSIDPKESRSLDISLPVEAMGAQTYPVLMKIFYEQPEPRRYVFTISISADKDEEGARK